MPEDKLTVIRDVLSSIARIEHGILQGEYVQVLAEELRVPDAELRSELKKLLDRRRQSMRRSRMRTGRSGATAAARGEDPPSVSESQRSRKPLPAELLLLKAMLEEGRSMIRLIMGHMSVEEFTEGPARDLAVLLVEMFKRGKVRIEEITGGEAGEALQALATDLLTDRYELSKNWARITGTSIPGHMDDPEALATSAIVLLKRDRLSGLMKQAQQDLYNADREGTDPNPILERMASLQRQRRELETGKWRERNGT